MIIEEFNESGTEILKTTWKFKNSDQEYILSWNVCENPFCSCGEMSLGIGLVPKTPVMASFSYDVTDKTVKKIGSDCSSKLLSNQLVSELSSEDHKILAEIFHAAKIKSLDECDVDAIDPPDFPIKEIEEESLMVEFKQIFPWSLDYYFSIDNTTETNC